MREQWKGRAGPMASVGAAGVLASTLGAAFLSSGALAAGPGPVGSPIAAPVTPAASTSGPVAPGSGDPILDPGRLLATIHPDYALYIGRVRPLGQDEGIGLYMALVRPGATDPARRDSAPFTGPGSRNDILYNVASIAGDRSPAWRLLLLDHEYFHARHLAGTTSLPRSVPAAVERHYYEAAAWGFNVGEARAGRYPGLRPREFREALDRYGEHYAALKSLLQERDSGLWEACAKMLQAPAALLTTSRPPR